RIELFEQRCIDDLSWDCDPFFAIHASKDAHAQGNHRGRNPVRKADNEKRARDPTYDSQHGSSICLNRSRSGLTSSGERQPQTVSARASSERSISSTRVTPSSPAKASPQNTGLPIATAVAPSASALTISVPRRIPPSISRGTLPATASRIAGSSSI